MEKIIVNAFCRLQSDGSLIHMPAKTTINVKETFEGAEFKDMLVNNYNFNTSRFVILCDGSLLDLNTKITFNTLCQLLEKHKVLIGAQ